VTATFSVLAEPFECPCYPPIMAVKKPPIVRALVGFARAAHLPVRLYRVNDPLRARALKAFEEFSP
jgi:hypothetical protein